MGKQKLAYLRKAKTGSVRPLLVSLWLHKLRIAAVVGVTLLLTILYFKAKPELYQATSTVKLGYWPDEMLLVKHDLASQATGSFNTELEILRSKLIASRVIEQLDLLHHSAFLHQAIQPWFYWWERLSQGHSNQLVNTGLLTKTQLLKQFAQGLTITPIVTTQMVKISFSSWDPQLAQQVSVAVAKAYIDYRHAVSETASKRSMVWLIEEWSRVPTAGQVLEPPLLFSGRDPAEALESSWKGAHGIDAVSGIYIRALEIRREFEALAATHYGEAQLIDGAVLSEPVSRCQQIISLLIAGFTAFIISSLVVLFKHTLAQGFACREQLEGVLDVEVIAEVPKLKGRNQQWFVQGIDPWLNEPLRALRGSLQMRPNGGQLVLFCSALEGEGKTSLAIQTATACSEVEKVLLIDADLHRASASICLNYSFAQPGLTHLLARTHSVAQCIHRDPQLGFDVLNAGLIGPGSASLLASKKFGLLLTGLRQHYDRVLLDSRAVLQVPDAMLIGGAVDAIFLVIEAERTDIQSLKRTLNKFTQAGLEPAGVVLNKVTARHRPDSVSSSPYH